MRGDGELVGPRRLSGLERECRRDAELRGEHVDRAERQVPLAALEPGEVAHGHAELFRDLLLRESTRESNATDLLSESLSECLVCHHSTVTGGSDDCQVVIASRIFDGDPADRGTCLIGGH